LHQPHRFLALRLIGDGAAQLRDAVLEADVDAEAVQSATLVQVLGDAVSHLLVGRRRRQRQRPRLPGARWPGRGKARLEQASCQG